MKFFVRREYLWVLNSPPITEEDADSFLTYLIIGVILGGRLGYVFFYNFDYYLDQPLDILRIWDGGMAFHGGFLGVVLAVIIYCSKNNIPLWSGADLIAVSSPPGLLFGRLANFINSELWGRPTDVPWGVIFPGERAQDCELVIGLCARHPTQLYEAALEGLILFIILFSVSLRWGFKKKGVLTGLFALVYGLSRFLVEYFRVPDPQFFSSSNPYGYAFKIGEAGLTMGQFLSLPMILAGSFILLRLRN